jgi:hypothetical protein
MSRFVAAARARPARWDLLPKVGRAQVRVLRVLAAHLAAGRAWSQVAPALRRAFPGEPRLVWQAPQAFPRIEVGARFPAPIAMIRFRRADGRGLAVALESVLAARLVGRVLGSPAELPAPRALTLVERGVLSGLAALAAEAVGVPGLRVEGVADDPASVTGLLPDPWVVAAEARLIAGELAGQVRVLLPESLLHFPPAAPAPELKLSASLVIGRAFLADLAQHTFRLRHARHRRAVLHVAGGALDVDTATARVLTAWRRGDPMPDDTFAQQLTVPLDCRLARLDLSVRELGELTPGAVLGLGKPLGGTVELCAGDKVMARGELVDIEGELGVRVTQVLR